MRSTGGIILGLILAPGAALAAAQGGPQAPSPPGLSLAIYAQGQALAQDDRRVDLAAGPQTIPLPGLPMQTRPETLTLSGDGISGVEIAFTLAPDATQLLQRMVGRPVRILRTPPGGPPTSEQGTFLGQGGAGLLVAVGDHIEFVGPANPAERLVFDAGGGADVGAPPPRRACARTSRAPTSCG